VADQSLRQVHRYINPLQVFYGTTEQHLIINHRIAFMSGQKCLGNAQQLLVQVLAFNRRGHIHDSGDAVVGGATGRASRRKSGPAKGKCTAGLGIPLGESSWVISNSARTDQPQASDVHCKYATRRKI
jgi:hypothetical protein